MPAFSVQRSVLIDATPEKVFDTVSDFGTWTTWSPWLPAEKTAKVTVSENANSVGSTYHWVGEVVGEGQLEHIELHRPQKIIDDIRFIKPWESRSDVGFEIRSSGGQTEITWRMNGKLPFFMFWMKSMMETFIGMDYERGLKMLKEYIETGVVLSDVDVSAPIELADAKVSQSNLMIGMRDRTQLDQIGDKMQHAFSTTYEKLTAAGVSTDGDMISVYHPSNIKKGVFEFTSGITVPEGTNPPSGLDGVSLPTGKAMFVRHTGSYENLGNAWAAAHQVARYRKWKFRKSNTFEIYRNDPEETERKDLITDLYLPTK